MEVRLSLHRYKSALIANAIFMAVLLAANPIAQSFGWMPPAELVRTARVRASRAGRRLRDLFD